MYFNNNACIFSNDLFIIDPILPDTPEMGFNTYNEDNKERPTSVQYNSILDNYHQKSNFRPNSEPLFCRAISRPRSGDKYDVPDSPNTYRMSDTSLNSFPSSLNHIWIENNQDGYISPPNEVFSHSLLRTTPINSSIGDDDLTHSGNWYDESYCIFLIII